MRGKKNEPSFIKYTAEKLAEHLVYLHMNVHNVIELTLPLKYYNKKIFRKNKLK